MRLKRRKTDRAQVIDGRIVELLLARGISRLAGRHDNHHSLACAREEHGCFCPRRWQSEATPRISWRSLIGAPESGVARRYEILQGSAHWRRLYPGVDRKVLG